MNNKISILQLIKACIYSAQVKKGSQSHLQTFNMFKSIIIILSILKRCHSPLWIDNKRHPNQKINYQNISIFKIISPIGPDFSLSPNVPHVQLETFGLDRLDVEALCRGDVSCILWGQGFQDCCFASIVLSCTNLINIVEL